MILIVMMMKVIVMIMMGKTNDHNDYDDRWLPLAFSMGKSNRGDEIAAAAAS